MPLHKRQHFLAQQHIRRWSATGKSVSAFDKKRFEVLDRVSIRSTGQEDYYYEREPVGVEGALAGLEEQMKEVVDRIHDRQALPTLEEGDRVVLMAYASTQLVRKDQVAGPARKMLSQVLERMVPALEKSGRVPPRPPELEGLKLKAEVENQWPRQMAVKAGAQSWPVLVDLEVMLLKSPRRRILLPDQGALLANRVAAVSGKPNALASIGACVLLPIGPEFCVVWFDWGVYRRTGRGKIHELTEEEELRLGARAIIQSERLTYLEEGAADWCVECAKHAWAVRQANGVWIPIPGLETPQAHKWDGMESALMAPVPPRPHVGRAMDRQALRSEEDDGAAEADGLFRAILTELDAEYEDILEKLNEGS